MSVRSTVDERQANRLDVLVPGLLLASAFLAPLIGGQINVRVTPIGPGYPSVVLAMLDQSGATLAHACLALLIAISFGIGLLRRSVLQLPQPRIAATALFFGVLLLLSIAVSDYKAASAIAFAQWASYIIAFFAVVGSLGRNQGPKALLGAFFSGCTVVAIRGIWEFLSQRDPTWRIFSTWIQPNALAGILALGLCVGIGLILSAQGALKLAPAIGSFLIAAALWLTGSKGGMLAVALGIPVALIMLLTALPKEKATERRGVQALLLFWGLSAIAVGLMLAMGLGGGSRVLSSGSSEQSVGFRTLLWKSSAKLMTERPSGWGLDTFQFESSRPGLIPTTHYAHETFLQLGAEATAAAPLLLLAFVLMCVIEMFRGLKTQPLQAVYLKAGVVAAVVAAVVNGLVESNLYMYGIGLCFFMLLAAGLQLSVDATVPEFTPRGWRTASALGSLVVVLYIFYGGWIDIALARVIFDLGRNDLAGARSGAEFITSFAGIPPDPRAWYTANRVAIKRVEVKDLDTVAAHAEAVKDLNEAISLGPIPEYSRRLASIQQATSPSDAVATLNAILVQDPNNLLCLDLLLKIEDGMDKEKAQAVAERLVAIEETPYFQTRAIPDVIPTQTFDARIYLADKTSDQANAAELLHQAVLGYMQFGTVTVPKVVLMSGGNKDGEYANITVNQCEEELRKGIAACDRMVAIYSGWHDAAATKWAQESKGKLQDALSSCESR